MAVYWNEGDALAIIPKTALAYEAPLLHEVDLTGLGGQTGTLTLKLISRGGGSGSVKLSEIRILESSDVDADGLSNTDEFASGTNVFEWDTDGDGLSDGEEAGTYLTDPTRADSDGDGQNDASELAAGTNPLQNGSYLRVTAVAKTAQGFMLQWPAVAGKSYRVLRSPELGTGNFDTLAFGPNGASGTTFTDPNPPPERAFYWIEVE